MEIWCSLTISILLIFAGIFLQLEVESCNEVVCASIVSKCMLTQSCSCDLKENCSCCKECLKCLGQKYFEQCCSCVELCPKPIDTRNALSKKSHVEEFDGMPELYNVLVSMPPEDSGHVWDIFTFPVDYDTISAVPKLNKDVKYYLKTNKNKSENEVIVERDNIVTVNCTVIYLDQCVSWNKCRQSCQRTGASSYRWFHDGCCECVGSTCINYGVNESRCRHCPEVNDMDDDLDETSEDDVEYFEDNMDPFDSSENT